MDNSKAHWVRRAPRDDFTSFIRKVLGTVDPGACYQQSKHINLIAEYLEAARRGKVTRLIINLPPRSLKSICVSVAWPAWLLGHEPRSRIIAASYSAPLALKHSLDCRLVMQSPWYRELFPDAVLARDQNEKQKFVTTQRGYRFATSVGGSLTGEGGNYLIIDDPLNAEQAMHAHHRDHVNRWFDHTFASRLDDKKKGVIVLVMQRLHVRDLSGYLLEKGGWQHVCLPAVAPGFMRLDYGRVKYARREGSILHPEREDAALIERAKIELGSAAFAAQYQQQPQPESGAMVRPWWLVRYEKAPLAFERVVQSWDTAIKSGEQHDASVCLTFGELEGRSYLVDACCARVEYPELRRLFMHLASRWQPQAILIEDRASGQQLLQDMRREGTLPLIPCQSRHDKITRFAAISAMIEAGRLLLPVQASWLADFEAELFSFPAGRHDDHVDALTQYLDWVRCRNWQYMRIRGFK